MAAFPPPALQLLLALLFLAARAAGTGIMFPCHQRREEMGNGVTCERVALPKGLCSECPLRPPHPDGSFVKCWDIYNDRAPNCLPKLREYAEANPCDVQRVRAVAALEKNPNDGAARGIVDYFLYSVCEQCCDCIPMGSNNALYSQYLARHTAADPTLYTSTRGNCPAHAMYDICKVVPKVTHFTNIGDTSDSDFDSWPPACPMLKKWGRSPAASNWQENPETQLEPDLNRFMLNMLEKLQCERKDAWDKCYALESAQNHLGTPEEVPEVATPTPSEVATTPSESAPAPESAPITEALDTATPTIPPPITKNGTSPPRSGSGGSSGSDSDVTGAAADDNSTRPCFPASATAQLRSGATVSMAQLRIGDEVRVAHGRFSTVYLFSHRDAAIRARHLRIRVSSGAVLTLTAGHYLPVNGVHAPAATVAVGDVLDGAAGPVKVVSVRRVVETGLYNPHTAAGTIVVDGVVCSTYTTAVTPAAAQALLAPLRALFRSGAVTEASAGGFLRRGADSFPLPVPVL